MAETIFQHFKDFGTIPWEGIGLGYYKDATMVHKFGSSPSLGTGFETVWPQGGLKSYRTTATGFTISSSDAADTATGTGARTVTVQGVDEDWNPVSQVVTLTGQTVAAMGTDMMICDRMIVETAGSGETNAGIIYVGTGVATTGEPAVVENLVSIGEGQSEAAFYAVRNNTDAYVREVPVSVGSGKILTAGLYVKPLGGVFNLKGKRVTPSVPTSIEYKALLKVAEKSIVEGRGCVDGTTANVTIDFDMLIIDRTATA